jgi:hypothetical protein
MVEHARDARMLQPREQARLDLEPRGLPRVDEAL